MEADPSFAPAHFALAYALSTSPRPEGALLPFRRGLELDPTATFARVGLVETLLATGHLQEHADEVSRVLAMDPGNAAVNHMLCEQGLRRGESAVAAEHCTRAFAGGAKLDARAERLARAHGIVP